MNPREYVKNVLITEARDFTPLQERFSQVRNIRLLHGIIGLSSELSEIREMARQPEIDVVNLKEETSDAYWYMGIIVDELKLDPEEIFDDSNIETLMEYCAENDINSWKKESLLNSIDSMTIRIGNISDFLKKNLMYGKELQLTLVADELKKLNLDIKCALATYGIYPSEARERNIEKLRARYGEKFTEAAALNRDLENERKVLENK